MDSSGGAVRARGLAFTLAPLVALILLSSCSRPVRLSGVEVRNFRGKNLSSINDFIENSIKGPQFIDKKRYRLRVKGLVAKPLVLSYDEVVSGRRRFEKVVRLDCVEGWSVTILWEGFLLRDLLDEAKVDPRAKVVILRSADGYSTSFPLSYFYQKDIIVADKMNGLVIPPERGFPFMLVAEDKWGWKWIKWITEIEPSADVNFRGYWEQRGYTNSGDRNKIFFGP